jgi:hypothetical protein
MVDTSHIHEFESVRLRIDADHKEKGLDPISMVALATWDREAQRYNIHYKPRAEARRALAAGGEIGKRMSAVLRAEPKEIATLRVVVQGPKGDVSIVGLKL